LAVREDAFLAAYGRDVADGRVEVVAAEVEREVCPIEAARGRLLHHELLHRHVRARGLTAVAREEILPRLRIEVDAGEAKLGDLGDAATHRVGITEERLEEVTEPDAEHRGWGG